MAARIWLIAGPTASGKSALALRLAEAVGGEIVNADSMQLYRDLRVLTARPSRAEERRTPHHLFGKVDAADGWSVGRWLRAAHEALAGIAGDAVVAGGTGLYFKALTEGLAEIPPISGTIRRDVAVEFEAMGEAAFRARLARADPAAAARIAPGDAQRLKRAWEVFTSTGRSLSDHHAKPEGALPAGSWTAVALEPPRAALYARCDVRLEAMVAEGALDEVRRLLARNLDPSLPVMKAVGVREFAAHLRGDAGLEDALARAQQETRRYAKRQATWMRGQMADWPRIAAADAQDQWTQFLALNPALTA
jgi:tRNA dimethylallyltransferase